MRPFDSKGLFRPFDNDLGLGQLAVRSAGVTVSANVLGLAIQIISTVILARLLLPRDFGAVAMVTTFSLLLVNFGLNGFTEAIIQREHLDHSLASNLFWISLSMSLLLTIGFADAGSALARFYHTPVVANVARGISPTIFFTGAQVVHLALLKRAMRFAAVSAIDLVSRALSPVISILLALRGWGYWSLVVGTVAQPFAVLIGAWWLCRWLPGLPRRAEGTGAMVRFALHVYGRFSFNYFTRNTDNVLVGWRFNAQSLGFYKKAYDLFALSAGLIVSSLTAVAISTLSRLTRDRLEYQRYFLRAVAVVALVGMGISGDLTLVGQYVIRMLLGPAWEPAGRIFTFFGPGIGMMLLYGMSDWIHLSIGRPDRWFRWSIFEYAVTALMFVLALPWGPAGVAIAWTISFWLLVIPAFWYAGRPIRFGIGGVFSVVWKFVLASAAATGASAAMLKRLPPVAVTPAWFAALIQILTASMLFGVLYLGAVLILHGGWSPLVQLAALLREMIPRRRFSPPASAARAPSPVS